MKIQLGVFLLVLSLLSTVGCTAQKAAVVESTHEQATVRSTCPTELTNQKLCTIRNFGEYEKVQNPTPLTKAEMCNLKRTVEYFSGKPEYSNFAYTVFAVKTGESYRWFIYDWASQQASEITQKTLQDKDYDTNLMKQRATDRVKILFGC